MKECDKRKSHISSKLHMVYISSNNVDTLLLRLSLHFTTLHPPTLHPPTLHSTSLHLSTLHFLSFKLHPTTLHYPLIWLNPIQISYRFKNISLNFGWTSITEAISITALLVKVNPVSVFFKKIRESFGFLEGHFKFHLAGLKCLN